MIFGDLVGLKLPDICLTGEEKPRKNATQETCPDRGSNPGPGRDRRACYHLLHSGGLWEKYEVILRRIYILLYYSWYLASTNALPAVPRVYNTNVITLEACKGEPHYGPEHWTDTLFRASM